MSFGALGRIIILKSAETLRLWLKADASRRQNGPRKQRLWRGEHSAARRKPVLPKKEERSKSGVMPRGSQAANVGEKTRSGGSLGRSFFYSHEGKRSSPGELLNRVFYPLGTGFPIAAAPLLLPRPRGGIPRGSPSAGREGRPFVSSGPHGCICK